MSAEEILSLVEQSYRTYFESEPARASVSFLGVEPIDILRFEHTDDHVAYVSLGMSRRPMTSGDEFVVSEEGPRAELLIQTRGDGGDLWRQLAVLAAAPVVEGLVFTLGASIDLATPLASGSRCTGAIVTVSELAGMTYEETSIEVFHLLPATANELAWSRVHGSDALQERWLTQQIDLLDLNRAGADLE